MCNLRVALPSEFNPRNPLISENPRFRLGDGIPANPLCRQYAPIPSPVGAISESRHSPEKL